MKQVRWFRVFGLAVFTLMFTLTLAAQGEPDTIQQSGVQAATPLQQKLNSQFKLTKLTPNGADIVGAGDVVEMQKDGLRMSALASPLMESNTYKDGKIGGGNAKRAWGGLGIAMLQGVAAGLNPSGTTGSIPGHNAATGEKLWVVAATAQKDGINFNLYSDADENGIRYHANLKVIFPNKKQVPSVDAAMQLVAEVLTVVPTEDQSGQPAQDGPMAALAGEYVFEMTGQRYIFHPDGSCSMRTPGGRPIQCHFIVDGNWIRVMMETKIGRGTMSSPLGNFKIQGDKLYMNGTIDPAAELIRQGVPPAPAETVAMAPSAPITPAPPEFQDIAPPPPPPASAPTINIGDRKAQVLTDFGEPQRKAVAGAKEIYFYSDLKMKIVFTNGKVSNIE